MGRPHLARVRALHGCHEPEAEDVGPGLHRSLYSSSALVIHVSSCVSPRDRDNGLTVGGVMANGGRWTSGLSQMPPVAILLGTLWTPALL